MQEDSFVKSTTAPKVLQRGNKSTLGVFLDDPPDISSLKEVFVSFYNGASRDTISRGVEKIRCGLMVSSNDVVGGNIR